MYVIIVIDEEGNKVVEDINNDPDIENYYIDSSKVSYWYRNFQSSKKLKDYIKNNFPKWKIYEKEFQLEIENEEIKII